MSTEAISPLRQRMIEDMNSRKLGAHTQRSHIYSCKRFAAFLERSPDTATLEDIRLFQLHLAETGMSPRQPDRSSIIPLLEYLILNQRRAKIIDTRTGAGFYPAASSLNHRL